MNTLHVDVVVIGGGPGGSTAGTLLAKEGLKVIILEREQFPRFKIGESMLPMVRELYERLGVSGTIESTFIQKHGAHFVTADGKREYMYEFKNAMDCPYGYAYHVKRDEHDQILLNNTRKAGADVRERWQVDDVLFEGERAVGVVAHALDGDPTPITIKAKLVVDASGRASLLSKKLNLRKADKILNKAAAFTHFKNVKRFDGKHEGSITIGCFPGGWIWVIPFKGDVTSVGAVMHHSYWRDKKEKPEEMFKAAMADCAPVKARLEGAEQLMPVMTEGTFSYKSDRFSGPGWVLCGDAACFLDPVFSSGVLLSMRCAEEIVKLAVPALKKDKPELLTDQKAFRPYEQRMRRGMGTFWTFIYGFYDEAFIDIFFRPTNRFRMMNAISGVLAGNIFPSLKFKARIWAMQFVVYMNRRIAKSRGIAMIDRASA